MVLDTRFHIWFIMTLHYKMRQIFLQNATAILLQNATKVYCKMSQVFYYKMRQLLQNAAYITNRDSKIWIEACQRFLQNFSILIWKIIHKKINKNKILRLLKFWRSQLITLQITFQVFFQVVIYFNFLLHILLRLSRG